MTASWTAGMTSAIQLSRMSGQGYKRTNFDEEDATETTPTSSGADPSVDFKIRSSAALCHQRSPLECVLGGTSVVFIFLSLILILVVVSWSRENVGEGTTTVTPLALTTTTPTTAATPQAFCLTPTCVMAAGSLLAAMDRSVDPCDDFYEYACGGWRRAHPIPAGHPTWESFGVMSERNQVQMRQMLEKPPPTPSSSSSSSSPASDAGVSSAVDKTKRYYVSCLDRAGHIDRLGAAPLVRLVARLGGWGVTGWPGAAAWTLQGAVQRVHALGFFSLFSAWVGADDKEPQHNKMLFDQGGLALSRDQYINKTIDNDTVLSAYLEFMTKVGVLLGGQENATRHQMAQVIAFEMSLAEMMAPQEERMDGMKLYHKMTLNDLQKISPFLEWQAYVNSLLAIVPYTVNGSERVVVYAPEYFSRLAAKVTAMLTTDDGKMILNNYMIWHVVKGMCLCLSKPFIDAHKAFTHIVTGVSGTEERWRECVADTDGTLGFALGAMFIRGSFHGASKQTAEVMINEIKEAFKKNLKSLTWIDQETRQLAIEKADAMGDMIGFPSYIMNKTALDEKYNDLEVKADDYFGNNMRDQHFTLKTNLEKLRKAPDRNSWSMTPAAVNAYYMPNRNKIIFPAGILQPPFYDQLFPKALNFGGMGIVMGHELTHAFDDQGREFDKFGTLRQWWKNDSIARFTERSQCLVEQYSNYSVHGEHVRGKLTLGENIADNGGVKSAYHAYENWIKVHGEESLLPGLNLTNRQLFFLSSAQVWCSNSKPEADHLMLMRDSHSPTRFRVIGPLSNLPAFSLQFHCAPGSPMNPVDKCEVW